MTKTKQSKSEIRRLERHKARRGVKKVKGEKKKALPIPEVRERRRTIVSGKLNNLIGREINCPCLGNAPVKIKTGSVGETSQHASKSILSMHAVPDLEWHIKNAKIYKVRVPKDNSTQKKFKIYRMFELHSSDRNGKIVKIMVGARVDETGYIHYSITVK